MLGPGWLGVAAVGGAVRNSSGHWRVECRQAELGHYRLELRPGYRHQHADCLVCTGLAGGPLIMRTAALASLAPQLPRALAPLDLALRGGGAALACPDIMFFTRGSLGQELDTVTREEWRHLAARHQLQGVSTQFRREMEAEFSCEEVATLTLTSYHGYYPPPAKVGLACEGWSQAAAFLLPWCCVLAFRHVLATLEAVTASLGLDYQLKAGSALGAVKLGNFIPWDIDIDVDFPSEHLHHFRPGGRAHQQLTEAGLQLYSFRRDMYSVAGAGMFLMQHGKSSFHTHACMEKNIYKIQNIRRSDGGDAGEPGAAVPPPAAATPPPRPHQDRGDYLHIYI